ncbi:MAG: 16S rRNA (cytosine(1402)-N(4))-methyltransferase RsmH [Candidatus Falkowbacteria bacterium]|nr:16S rRNA (cytosine(1402)-N(4))-methyltransferase RsmH [Candidatus Falkowbacteria bacterium]
MAYSHKPVMLREVLEFLNPLAGQKFIDCTLGGAGYTLALADRVGERGKVVAIDLDSLALSNAAEEIKNRKLKNIILIQDNFKNLETIIGANFPAEERFDGLVLDLGLSSAQLDDENRGFSFKGDRPLDMAFGPANGRSTADIVNYYPLLELTRIFREYGEERRAYQIAKAIVAGRRIKKFKTTAELIALIESAAASHNRSRIHPATRVFQALRMETNEELPALSEVLPAAARILKTGGRLVVVSFHSGEDRIVKRYLKDTPGWKILTKRPIIPTEDETRENPRARSAKLRAAIKI